MLFSKKFLSIGLSFSLVFSLTGVAYADPIPEDSIPQETESVEAFDSELNDIAEPEENDADDMLGSEPSSDEINTDALPMEDTSIDPGISEEEEALEEEVLEAEEAESALEADVESIEETQKEEPIEEQVEKIDAAELIEYVFIDNNLITLGETQNVAFALLDEEATITSAQAVFLRGDTDEPVVFISQTMVGNAALFAETFSSKEDTTSYRLQSISYTVEGSEEEICADFDTLRESQEGGTYLFEVVSEEIAEAFSEVKADEEVSAFVIDENDGFVAVDSMEEAIEVADTVGVNNFEEGDSIVDAETLAENEDIESTESVEEAEISLDEESVVDNIVSWFTPTEAYAAASKAREGYLIVALDAGHGGYDSGATGYGLLEKNLNLKIAQECKAELEKYTGVTVIMTRNSDVFVGLEERVNYAKQRHADVFISIHNNSSGTGAAFGAEVWVPNNSSYNNQTHIEGTDLGKKIVNQLASLGLTNRGVKTRNLDGQKYSDGSTADYYSLIRNSRKAGIPGIIVEHAFIDNKNDAKYLARDSFLKALGQADAKGIAAKYGLVTDASAKKTATVTYRGHIAGIGWQDYVYDQKVAGTTGKQLGVQAFDIKLQNPATSGGIQYRSYVTGSGWQGWKTDGAVSGTTGQDKTIQAMQVKLTGKMSDAYDVYYRVHVSNIGWLGWAKNGASAGSTGYNYNAEAFEVILVKKGAAAPGSTATPYKTKPATNAQQVKYQTHVQNVGWQATKANGSTSGTSGKSLRLEGIKLTLGNQKYSGDIQYRTHIQNVGWQGWKENGQLSGTTGRSLRLEAIQIKLTGDMAKNYDVYYRVHAQNFGWMGWTKNGASAGTSGYAYRLEAIQVKLVAKNGAAPGSTSGAYKAATIRYQTHVQDFGWQDNKFNGEVSGTSGKAKRLEGIYIALPNQSYSGNIQYRTHIQNVGWQGWKENGQLSGTTGRSLRLEAIQIKLTGDMAKNYDVYYRVHAQNFGWMGWAKNGASAGTAGYSYRLEAIQIKLVKKGAAAPGDTSGAYKEIGGGSSQASSNSVSGTPIMGTSKTSVQQMVRRWNSMGKTYPSSVYRSRGAANITQFCTILFEEAKAEGVRAEVVFAQTMHETGWLQFGGDVDPEQCNFAGLGATGGGVKGNSFSSVRIGLRAQVQHLKCYASTADLKNENVDPRWSGVVAKYGRGSAPTVEALSKKWATGATYGESLKEQMDALLKY